MSKVEITDELLYKYYPKVEEYLLEQLPKEEEIDYKFSEIFVMKMKKIIKQSNKSQLLTKFKYPKKIVSIFIVIIVSLFTLTISVEALRVQLFDLVKNVYEKFTLYQYNMKDTSEINENIPNRVPQYIPNGFKEINKIQEDDSLFLTYSNNYDYITFSRFEHTDTNVYLDTENANITKIKINGINADYIDKENNCKIMWQDFESVYILTLESLDSSRVINKKMELIKIAESVR